MPSEPAKKVANIDGNKNIREEVIRGIKFTLFSLSAGLIQIITFSILNEFTNWRYSACYLVA
ncbi:MAG: hypothetical protein PHU60_08385, partial [Tissierellia bacterium]|nr:hypothetical protein [Tissierellia bacterium]